MTNETIVKKFENPDELREFQFGKFEIVLLNNMTLGRATYQPGWKWSLHVGPKLGKSRCEVEHTGLVISGRCAVEYQDGKVVELKAGDLFYIPPVPHDSWTIGNEPYVSLHFQGAAHYAK